jgi:hypothetical protein
VAEKEPEKNSLKLNKEEKSRGGRKTAKANRKKGKNRRETNKIKAQNKTSRRYEAKGRDGEAESRRCVCLCAALCVFILESDFLTSCYPQKIFYKRRCGEGEAEGETRTKTFSAFFRPHKKFSHGIFLLSSGRSL